MIIMSERWKYQIKSGGFFALVMTLIFSLWESYISSFEEAFFSKIFIVRLILFLLSGIFAVGYFNWKEKMKKDSLNKQ
jgi:type IV secretory pathway TrbL component